MEGYLKTYKIVLETIGPVHIGSGRKIGKKEFIYDPAEKKAYIPNMPKMYDFFIKHKLTDKFEDYMLNDRRDFLSWLKSNGVTKPYYEKWTDYEIKCDTSTFKNGRKKEISTFVKDPYGNPYIPGSSLKGAIRTAVLGAFILGNKNFFADIERDVANAEIKGRSAFMRETKDLEVKCFNLLKKNDIKSNAVNDIMSGVIISDSKPLSTEDIILCPKVDVNIEGKEKTPGMVRECIKPGTKIEFDMTIDTSCFKYSGKSIIKFINIFLKSCNDMFYSKFKIAPVYSKGVVYLGGGSGFMSKTVIHQLLKDNPKRLETVGRFFERTTPNGGMTANGRKKPDHKHSLDARIYKVSPHTVKMTNCGNKKYHFGACSITIEEK